MANNFYRGWKVTYFKSFSSFKAVNMKATCPPVIAATRADLERKIDAEEDKNPRGAALEKINELALSSGLNVSYNPDGSITVK